MTKNKNIVRPKIKSVLLGDKKIGEKIGMQYKSVHLFSYLLLLDVKSFHMNNFFRSSDFFFFHSTK